MIYGWVMVCLFKHTMFLDVSIYCTETAPKLEGHQTCIGVNK